MGSAGGSLSGQAAHDHAFRCFDHQAVAPAIEMIAHPPFRKALVFAAWLVAANANHPACAAAWAMLPADNDAIARYWILHEILDRFAAGAVVIVVVRVAILAERVVAVALEQESRHGCGCDGMVPD